MYKDDFSYDMTISSEGESLPQTQLIKANLTVMFFEALVKMVNGGVSTLL